MQKKGSLKAFNSKVNKVRKGSFPQVDFLAYVAPCTLGASGGVAAYRASLACCATAFLPAAVRGMSGTLPLSPGLHFLYLLTPQPSPIFICLTFDLVVGFDGLHVPFFALCFCHPDSATPFGSVTLLRLIRLYSFFPFFPLSTTSTTSRLWITITTSLLWSRVQNLPEAP